VDDGRDAIEMLGDCPFVEEVRDDSERQSPSLLACYNECALAAEIRNVVRTSDHGPHIAAPFKSDTKRLKPNVPRDSSDLIFGQPGKI
jgi:hypothetical protein